MSSVAAVVETHADEAAFLWGVRDRAVRAPHYRLGQLARLDGRVEAHVDGLRIAGDLGWEIARAQLAAGEPGETFAAAVLAFGSRREERAEDIVRFAASEAPLARAVISALGWLAFEEARPWIERLAADAEPARARIGLRAAAVHRWSAAPLFERARGADDATLAGAIARAVGELSGPAESLAFCHSKLDAPEPDPRFWAAWTLALFGDAQATRVLREIAESDSCRAPLALDVAVRASDVVETTSWLGRLRDTGRVRAAIEAAGRHGDPAHVPWLIEQMSVPELARPAGESFSFVTGVDLAFHDLEGRRPPDFQTGPTEDPADESVAMDPDEDLPWPDPTRAREWWNARRHEFSPGVRYLGGLPLTRESLRRVLRDGPQRQRAAAALELRRGAPEEPLFEVRAPGFAQRRALGSD